MDAQQRLRRLTAQQMFGIVLANNSKEPDGSGKQGGRLPDEELEHLNLAR
jgi:hypothetical protein